MSTEVLTTVHPRVLHGGRQVTLLDILDRLLQGGIAIRGEIMLTVADIDLVALDLSILVTAANRLAER